MLSKIIKMLEEEGYSVTHKSNTPKDAQPVIQPLKVTQVNVFPVPDLQQGGKLKAFARVMLNDSMQLTSLRIYDGVNGMFVSYPNDPHYKGNDYRQLFYPVQKELRDHIEIEILKEYKKCLEPS